MYARIEDLKKGDEVIIGSSQGIYDVKLLRDPSRPKKGKTKTWGGADKWVSIPCSLRIETLIQIYTSHNGTPKQYITKRKVLSNGKGFNDERRIDFSEKECWVIKRALI